MRQDKTKENDINESFRREYSRRGKLVMTRKLNGTNVIKVNNTWTMLVRKQWAIVVKQTKLNGKVNCKTRILIMRNKDLQPERDIDRLCVSTLYGK